MLRIKFHSPLIALIATCGIAVVSTFGQSAFAEISTRPGGGFGGGGHGPASPGGNHGGNHGGGGGFGGGHGPAPGGNPGGYHPPAPTPGGNHGGYPGGNHGGYPGGNHGGYHPPAPAPAPAPGGNHGGYPGGNHGGNPGGYHPPAPTPGGNHGGYPGGNHGGYPGGNHGGNHGGYPGGHGNPHGGYPVGHPHGPGYSYGHDHHGNIVSPIYRDRIDLGRRRMDDMRRDTRVRTWVDYRAQEFRSRYRDSYIRYNDRFTRYRDMYRDRYRPWWSQGFYGGCYWEFHPYYEIDTYFYNPVVYWFFMTDFDDYYFRTWYGPSYDRYPIFRTRYRYARVFFPTEELRDLYLGVSAMSVDAQANFFQASTVLGNRLEVEAKIRGGRALGEQDVVINHYQVLPDDKGVVVEGVVNQDRVQFSFKAVQNLSDPDSTRVFAVSADQDINGVEMDQLRDLNTQIEDLGGVAEGADDDAGTDPAYSNDGQFDPGYWNSIR